VDLTHYEQEKNKIK